MLPGEPRMVFRKMITLAVKQPEIHRNGWTYIELLTTIIILVIASVVLIPHATSGASASGQSATRFVVTDILAAQMDAVATQSFRRIHFFSDGSGWCVEVLDSSQLAVAYDSATAMYAQDATESQGHEQQSFVDFTQDSRYKNISIQSPIFDGANQNIIFDQTGGVIAPDGSPSTGGSFEVHSGNFAWLVQLAPLTGKLTVVDLGDVGGAP